MGFLSSGSSEARKARRLLRNQFETTQNLANEAGAFAEQQLSPYMMDPAVMQELQGAVMGGEGYRNSPIFNRYMDIGRETMLEDMAGTGTLYSGKRMEGIRDLGQSAYSAYMQNLMGLADFGRDTAAQLGGIRMNTANTVAGAGQNYAENAANSYMAVAGNRMNRGLGLINAAASGAGAYFGD